MNALRMAQDAINQADHIRNADRWSGDRHDASVYKMQEAQAYAAIAQAEQLKRIACALEYIANAQVALAAAAYGAYPSSPYPNLKQIYEEEPPEPDAMGPGYEDLPY